MARNVVQKNKDVNGAAASPPPQEGIDQVRDLLFGGQMRMVDARIQSLDERLAHETSALRSEFDRQIADLSTSIKKELARHADKLVTESTKRVDDMKALSAELRDSLRSLEKRHNSLEEAAGMADADLRDSLLKHSAALSADIARTSERLGSEMDRITGQLQADKLDSSALVAGLTDLAARLGGQSSPPKKAARS
jgi:hypothetical protein